MPRGHEKRTGQISEWGTRMEYAREKRADTAGKPLGSEAGAHAPRVIRSLRSGLLQIAKSRGARSLFANPSKMISHHPRLDTVRPTARSPIKAIERTAATARSKSSADNRSRIEKWKNVLSTFENVTLSTK